MAGANTSFRPPSFAGRTHGVRVEVADVLRRHGEAYLRDHAGHVGRSERRVMGAITACRTSALGGHVEACDDCGAMRVAYNSCRDRHCPKCQGAARAQWLADRQAELLPVPYFHVVFTLPPPVATIAFQNKAAVYAILFKSAVEAMTTLAANPRRLGAKIGGLAILHTWGQALTHHPHVHCVVPGGGLSVEGARWVSGRANFFLAVKPLSRLFRRLFLERLQVVFDTKGLGFFGDLAHLAAPAAFAAHLASARRADWIVYAKKPFGGPAQVLAYLGRYTHRVAISNSRIQACGDDHVAFTWKDYRDAGQLKTMRLTPDEFIRRFLLHVLPDGFRRIRHFGFLANGHRTEKLALCRSLLTNKIEPTAPAKKEAPASGSHESVGVKPPPCPECGGAMRIVVDALHGGDWRPSKTSSFRCDTS
jgi:Putative transposase/Transposase zinc-binding domain